MNQHVHYRDDAVTLYTGDATTTLAGLPDRSVDCVVTSPPYWGLRDYGTGTWAGGDPGCTHLAAAGRGSNLPQPKHPRVAYPASAAQRGAAPQHCRRCGARREDEQHGLEPSPQDYVDRLRGVFAQLHRVLADTGTVWLNLGDSYSADPPGPTRGDAMRASTLSGRTAAAPLRDSVRSAGVRRTQSVPRKNLLGIPWRVAFALQTDGWILRNAIVWHKPNAMPESVRDRLSNRYEMLFLLVKQQKYFFDLDPVREPPARPASRREGKLIGGSNKDRVTGIDVTARHRGHGAYGKHRDASPFAEGGHRDEVRPTGAQHTAVPQRGKNPGDVWSITTRPLREAHFAAFPIDIPLRCVAAGCPEGGVVLDPFSGAATTGVAARQLDRSYIGIDLNPQFHDVGLGRLGLATDGTVKAA
ncbi:DNA-methyltransferase [Amycolatopsis saalfeldensis]|uniref:Methyltransferase n=1 Tax=Amycolatopsis saalfeldensis TaxID=394193 RepID=A0A1H8YQR9_9PSEU|nr:site-specific DNA-methyltransferase [Amycolatopsis saalfeldensis]SEP54516.1 site-specific DNA-methyltransferase (cytosine-N4-specific) [Amycolatopsis saalfeldensis]